MTPGKINWFLLFKLPSAWFCGVRVKAFSQKQCKVGVRHRWINQNPFRSMYFAVQNMAAELSTGVLVMNSIKEEGVAVSMLVIETQSQFFKKATGLIHFECLDGLKAKDAIRKSIQENISQEIDMSVKAYNGDNEVVSTFSFKWSVKPKK